MTRALALFLVLAAPASAQLELPAFFADHMVLQRERPVAIWGRAEAHADVEVSFAEKVVTAKAGADGRWKAAIGPFRASAKGRVLDVRCGERHVALHDVVVGEVWLCSGQSNMVWKVAKSNGHEAAKKLADRRVRSFNARPRPHEKPRDDLEGWWREATPETVGEFSGVAYWYGQTLLRALDVPIGLVTCARGGSAVGTWIRREALAGNDWGRRLLARDIKRAQHRPSLFYNGMIHPVRDLAFRGVIWYQGEYNGRAPASYFELFPLLIRDWRQLFDDAAMPFYFVQLANLKTSNDWPTLRQAQLETSRKVAHTGMAVTIDVGDSRDIHPRNKRAVGERLARWALARTYGREIVPAGPVFTHAGFDGSEATCHFDLLGSSFGRRRDGPLRGFEACGPDGRFVAARARIAGPTVVVEADGVEKIEGVRYAWASDPGPLNLVNAEGLPASPFRAGRR